MVVYAVISGLVVLAVVVWVVAFASRRKALKQLAASGVDANAKIVGKAIVYVTKSRKHTVTYEFRDPTGAVQKQSAYVTEDFYIRAEQGSPIAVVYLPEKPSVNALKGVVEAERP